MAVVAAEAMRESGKDEHHLANMLRCQHRRPQNPERLRVAAENCLNFGQEERRHAVLVRAIGAACQARERATATREADFGPG